MLKGEKPELSYNDKFAIFEVSWGPLEKSQGYVQHIIGAYHLIQIGSKMARFGIYHRRK